MTVVTDQIEWLRTQIQDRKATAEAASQGEWVNEGGSIHVGHETNLVVDWVYERTDAAHIVDNQPRDTIARCDSELALLDLHSSSEDPHAPSDRTCDHCDTGDPYCTVDMTYPCRTVRLLAQGYRHRPGYPREETP